MDACVGTAAVGFLICFSRCVYGLDHDVKEEQRQGVPSRFREEGKDGVSDSVNVRGHRMI